MHNSNPYFVIAQMCNRVVTSNCILAFWIYPLYQTHWNQGN